MIERFYLKNYLTFSEAVLEFNKGLVVFSGPSGSGKSILMNAILSSFGFVSAEASLAESSVTWQIDPCYGIENDEINVFKQLKKEKNRYFINNQSVSKKNISHIASNYLRHLSLKDYSDFENENLLEILDNKSALHSKKIIVIKEQLQQTHQHLTQKQKELQQILDEQKKVIDLKEFTAFEIQKIEDINPKIGEYEELMQIKKELSKKEKVLQGIEEASKIFEYEYQVTQTLELLGEESSFFDELINELRTKFDTATERFEMLDEIDVEEVLNRLEILSDLKRQYGSIEEALEYLQKKKKELLKYENIEFEIESLENEVTKLQKELHNLAEELSALRKKELKNFQKDLQHYTKELYLENISLELSKQNTISSNGMDKLSIKLKDTVLEKISTGEFNRLRLAVLAIKAEFLDPNSGVLLLDEIDANLSGEESMSVAKVLRKLAKKFQIFVISHQPQLTSMGEQHFYIYKENDISHVKQLQQKERITEIARIISGDKISNEALEFAKKLLQ